MKVVAFNGSPKKEGNTYHALKLVGDELQKAGIEFEIVHVGIQAIRGCMGCGYCAKSKDKECVIKSDKLNEWIKLMDEADGILIGSPVHFSGVSGTMKSFLDRAFYVHASNDGFLRHKVGAAVVAVRRGGGSATLDQLNHFLTYAEMFMPTSNYWNVIHGTEPRDVYEDEEGQQIMRVLGKNMAYLMKVLEASKGVVEAPKVEEKIFTSFVR